MNDHDDRYRDLLETIQQGDTFWSGNQDPQMRASYVIGQRIDAIFAFLRTADSQSVAERQVLITGERLGEFEILGPLGFGGMGQVYQAVQHPLNRIVALKICDPLIATDPVLRNQFTLEAMALARLKHPNIVPVLTTGEDRGYLYLAMEFVPGSSLAAVLAVLRGGAEDEDAICVLKAAVRGDTVQPASDCDSYQNSRISDQEHKAFALRLAHGLALGVAEIHQAGLLHLDIKPANIVLQPEGTPVIVDFGLARRIRGDHSQDAMLLGTPAYAPPEQMQGDFARLCPASDVFSIGMTLRECLTLHVPSESHRATIDDARDRLTTSFRKRKPKLGWELVAIIDKCCETQPSSRYPDASELADDLSRYINGTPIRAKTTCFRQVRYWATEKPFRAALVAWPVFIGLLAVAILILQLIFGFTDEFPPSVDEADARFCSVFLKTKPDKKLAVAAIEQYTICLKLRPSDTWCLMQRAILYFHANRIPEAIFDLQQLDNRHPDYASVNQLLASACQEMGDLSKSREYRSLARKIYPTRSEDLFWLGHIASFILNDADLAGYYWTACLLRTPGSSHTFGPRDTVTSVSQQTYNVHFLSRRLYAEHCLDSEASLQQLNLSRDLRPDLAARCEAFSNSMP
jgi:serine/threonine protein kinase